MSNAPIATAAASSSKPSFIAAAMSEHGKPTTPPIVPLVTASSMDEPAFTETAGEKPALDDGVAGAAAFVICNLGSDEKPRASWFAKADRLRAIDAVRGSALMIIDTDNEKLRAVASELPEGKIHDSGKPYVPFAKKAVFEAFAEALPADAQKDRSWSLPRKVTAEMMNTITKATSIGDRSKMTVGTLVLADEAGAENDDWYVAVIMEELANNLCGVAWRDYPEEGIFTRARNTLALAPPTLPTIEWE